MSVVTETISTVPVIPAVSTRTRRTTRPVWRVGVKATLLGAVATEAFSLVFRAAGVPMKAADPGAAAAKAIPVGGVGMAVVIWGLVGVVMAVVMARTLRRPARPFVITTVVLTALSILGPAVAPHTAVSTQLVLSLAHVLAAAIVIPPLAHRLADNER